MDRSGISLFRIAGIQIRIDYSWFLIFLLVLVSLSAGYFPRAHPDQTTATYWGAGLVATLLFFASILAHELAHSLVALRAGIRIPAITLFLFGGVSHMEEEPRSPGSEIRIAIVGPLMSFALAAAFWGLARALGGEPRSLLGVVFVYLAWINAALGVFNLIPGFPMDGGRVFRALVWRRTGSLVRATRLASDVGKGFAVALMVLGAIEIFSGALVGGLWLVFIGMFLRGMAGAGYQGLLIRQALEDVSVEQVMIRDAVSVDPDLPIRRLIDDYFLTTGYRGFPVVKGSDVLGVVSIAEVAQVPAEQRDRVRVREQLRALTPELRIAPDASLGEALRRMAQNGGGRLLVMRGERLEGMITKTGLLRFVELRRLLEPE